MAIQYWKAHREGYRYEEILKIKLLNRKLKDEDDSFQRTYKNRISILVCLLFPYFPYFPYLNCKKDERFEPIKSEMMTYLIMLIITIVAIFLVTYT